MTKAEINILIRTRAKEARMVVQALMADFNRLSKAAANAGAVMDALSAAGPGYKASLGGTSAAAANLAKSLSLINKSGISAAKGLDTATKSAKAAATAFTAAGKAASMATTQINGMATAGDRLTASLNRQNAAASSAAASFKGYAASAAAAGRAAGKAADAAAGAGAGAAAGSAASGAAAAAAAAAAGSAVAMRRATQATQAYNAASGRAAASNRGLTRSWFDMGGTIRATSTRMDGMSAALDGMNRRAISGGRAVASSWYDVAPPIFRASQRMDQAGQSALTSGQRAITAGNGAAAAMGTYAAAAAGAQRAVNQTGSAAQGAADRTNELNNRARRGSIDWGAFNTRLYESSNALRKAGSQMQWTGRQLSVMFTAPTLLATGLGVKWAMEQEKAFTKMAKVYDGAISDIDNNLEQSGIQFSGSKFDKFFTALSEKMGQTKTEVATIGSIWAQVGAQGRNLAEATKLTTEFMVVGDQDAEKSARDLISIQAQYKISIGELTKVIHDLNAIENATAVSMKDLADGFTRTAAVAREAGVDTRNLGAFIAALVPAAGTAAVSANGLKSIFTRIMTPAADAREALANLGITVSDPNWMSKNAVERLKLLGERMEGLSQQQKFDLAKPFAGLYQINKFVALMDDLASAQGYYAKALKATEDPAKSFATYQRELNRVLESSPQKFKQVGVILQNSLVQIITPLIPHILYLAQGIAKLMKSFSEMNPVTQKWIVLALLALAAVGPLAMLIGSFAILFGAAGKSISKFASLLGLVGKAAKWAGARIGLMFLAPKTGPGVVTKAYAAMVATLRAISVAGVAAINGIWIAGMAGLNAILAVGGALGLKRFAWYEAMRAKVSAMSGRRLVATEVATQTAMTTAAVAGGQARVAAAGTSGAAAGAAAAAGTRKGLFAAAAAMVLFFPQTIWKGIKAIPGLFQKIWPQVINGAKQIGPKLLGVLARLLPRLAAWAGVAAGVLSGPIGWAILALVTIITLFPTQVWNALKGLGSIFARAFGAALTVAGDVIRGLGQLVSRGMNWVMQQMADMAAKGVPLLARPFVLGVRMAGAALSALPKIVAAVFRGVVSVITRAAQAVYNAFSYINPFARHSPSLVENVTNGMAIVKDEFASMADSVDAETGRAYEAIRKFGEASAGLNLHADDIELQKKRDSISRADPSGTALPAYDDMAAQLGPLQSRMDQLSGAIKAQEDYIDGLNERIEEMQDAVDAADAAIDGMNDTLDRMRDVSEALSDALSDAQERLDYFANAPIKGMEAMSDAIFENEMAQNRLRLEIMRLEDAGQSIDSVKDKYAELQGQIESLSGQREELRQKGAGSDVLGVYDKMIADLQAQQGATATEGVSEIEKAQKALEKLQREGEKLDLENSLKFDPLTRQIDKMINSTKELSFEEITAGIRTNKAAVDGLTIAYEASNAAIEIQEKVIAAAEAARDALSDKIEVEQAYIDSETEKLEALQEQHDKVSEAIDAVTEAMDTLITSADTVNQYYEEQAQAAEQAANEQERLAKEAEKSSAALDKAAESAAAFENAGLGDFDVPGGENFDLSAMMGGDQNFDDLTKQLSDDVAGAFEKIDLTKPIKDFFGRIGNWFKELPGQVGGWFAGVGTAIGGWFAQLPGQVGGWFAGLGSAVGGWFGGLWTNHIWPGLQALPGQIGTFLMELPNNMADAFFYMIGFMAGLLVKAIAGAFMFGVWIRDKISEGINWIVTNGADLIVGLVTWFAQWPPKIMEALGRMRQALADAIVGAIDWLINELPGKIPGILNFFAELPGKIGQALWDLGATLISAFASAIDWLINEFPTWAGNIIDGLRNGIVNAVKGIGSWVKQHVVDPFVQGFKDALGINSPSTLFAGFGKNIIEGLWNGIVNIKDWIVDKVKGMAKDYIVDPVKDVLGIKSPSKVFMGIGQNLGQGLALGMNQSASGAATAATAMAQAVADAAGNVAAAPAVEVESPLIQPPTPEEIAAVSTGLLAVQTVYSTSYTTLAAMSEATYTGMAVTSQGITDTMIGTLGASTAAYVANTGMQYAGLGTNVTTTTANMANSLVGITDSMMGTLTGSWDNGRSAITNATIQMADDGTNAFQSLADNMTGIMDGQLRPMFESFDPMLQTVTGWFTDTVGNIGTQWAGVKEPVAVPSRFIVNDVYNKGIRVAWNNVAGWIGEKELPEAIAAFQSGGFVDRRSLHNPNTPRDVTMGGKLNGSTVGDRTLFAGQGGEFVWNRRAVDRAGGPQVLAQAQAALVAGRSMEGMGSITNLLPGFADGGTIPGKVLDGQAWARKTFTGQRYVYGGVGPNGFDCSGAVGAMWAYLTDKAQPFQRWFTTEANFPSFGFQRGLNGAFTMGVHNGGGGMLSHTAATLGGINLEAGGSHNSSIFGGPAAGSDNPQFENQWTLAEIGGKFASGGMGGGSAPSMLDRVTAEFKRIMDPIKDTWPQVAGAISALDPKGYQKNYDSVSKHLYGKASEWDAAHPPVGNMPYDGSGVEQWRPLVQKILQAKGLPLSLDEVTLRRMQKESGGNPNAINDWDINAQNGTPSKGLMQVIDPTFQAHKDGGFDNIWAPEDNIRAAMNYAKHRYGSIEAGFNQPGGYDKGGLLPPTPGGFGTFFNHTGKVEKVLTDPQWNGIFDIAKGAGKFTSETVEVGVVDALRTVYGSQPTQEQAQAEAAALAAANKEWTPLLYDAAESQVAAANSTAAAAKKTQTGVEKFVEVGKDIQTGVQKFSTLMLAIASAMQDPNSFGAWAPVLNAAADFIESLPEMEPTYVPWAGTNQPVTEEMKRQKALNDAANAGKGLYNLGKAILPPLLKHTAIIGSAIENLITANGPIVAAAIAMFPVNPIGAAIMLIPVILQAIFTILPLIINAIMDIVPTLIKAIMKFLASFMPDSVYAYDTYEAADKAAKDNEAAIKAGASAPYFVTPEQQSNSSNSTVTINVYGVNVEAKDQNSADQFVSNLQNLS